MINRLIEILFNEEKVLKELLSVLEKQHKMIIKKDVFGMEGVVTEIKEKNKLVAEWEVERRKAIGNKSIKEVILISKSIELDTAYRSIQKTLNAIKLQKETNEILIKQGISYTNKLLNIINPKREVNVYNSYGAIRR